MKVEDSWYANSSPIPDDAPKIQTAFPRKNRSRCESLQKNQLRAYKDGLASSFDQQ
jgi:hypothetical protein